MLILYTGNPPPYDESAHQSGAQPALQHLSRHFNDFYFNTEFRNLYLSFGMAVPIEPHFVNSNHDALYAESINDPERFWGTLAKQRLRWMKDFHTVMDCDMNAGKISWFLGGKLNVSGE